MTGRRFSPASFAVLSAVVVGVAPAGGRALDAEHRIADAMGNRRRTTSRPRASRQRATHSPLGRFAPLGEDTNLALLLVGVDAGMVQGWPLLPAALTAVCLCGAVYVTSQRASPCSLVGVQRRGAGAGPRPPRVETTMSRFVTRRVSR